MPRSRACIILQRALPFLSLQVDFSPSSGLQCMANEISPLPAHNSRRETWDATHDSASMSPSMSPDSIRDEIRLQVGMTGMNLSIYLRKSRGRQFLGNKKLNWQTADRLAIFTLTTAHNVCMQKSVLLLYCNRKADRRSQEHVRTSLKSPRLGNSTCADAPHICFLAIESEYRQQFKRVWLFTHDSELIDIWNSPRLWTILPRQYLAGSMCKLQDQDTSNGK